MNGLATPLHQPTAFSLISTRLTVVLVLLVSFFVIGEAAATTENAFSVLRGNWRGTGIMRLNNRKQDRLVCRATYSGTDTQLLLSIRCRSSSNEINMRAKLSANSGRLFGTWQEKTFNANGVISGIVQNQKIQFYIGGNVLGNMAVEFSGTHQTVTVKTTGISLQNVKIKLNRQ